MWGLGWGMEPRHLVWVGVATGGQVPDMEPRCPGGWGVRGVPGIKPRHLVGISRGTLIWIPGIQGWGLTYRTQVSRGVFG